MNINERINYLCDFNNNKKNRREEWRREEKRILAMRINNKLTMVYYDNKKQKVLDKQIYEHFLNFEKKTTTYICL